MRDEFPIERYEAHIPRLKRQSRIFGILAGILLAVSSVSIVAFGLSPEHPMFSLGAGGGMAVVAWASILARNTARNQIRLIEAGGRPSAVWFKLTNEPSAPAVEKGFADSIAEIQAEAERAAEDESKQWWRKEGSLWYETQQFINATGEIFKAAERAEYDCRMAEQRAALKAREELYRAADEERRIAEAKADEERRIEATKRWIEEQKEWDAFKEDAQMDARGRKERGEFYEPPMGVPGAIEDDEDHAKLEAERISRERLKSILQELDGRITNSIMANYSYRTPGRPRNRGDR
jgi:hypothetical protein